MTPIEQIAKEHGEETFSAISKNESGDVVIGVAYSFNKTELEALRESIIKDFVNGLENPEAWTSPDRSVLHRVTKDTFFGSHTIPLFDLSLWRDK